MEVKIAIIIGIIWFLTVYAMLYSSAEMLLTTLG